MHAVTFVSVALLVVQASASTIFSRSPLHALLARQSTISLNDIPTSCQRSCTVAIDALNSCTSISCLCATKVQSGLASCFECALGLAPDPTLLATAQDSMDEFTSTCVAEGAALKPVTLTIPGGSSTTRTTSTTRDTSTTRTSGTAAPSLTADPNTTSRGIGPSPMPSDDDDEDGDLGNSGIATRNPGAATVGAAVSSVVVGGALGVFMVVLGAL